MIGPYMNQFLSKNISRMSNIYLNIHIFLIWWKIAASTSIINWNSILTKTIFNKTKLQKEFFIWIHQVQIAHKSHIVGSVYWREKKYNNFCLLNIINRNARILISIILDACLFIILYSKGGIWLVLFFSPKYTSSYVCSVISFS